VRRALRGSNSQQGFGKISKGRGVKERMNRILGWIEVQHRDDGCRKEKCYPNRDGRRAIERRWGGTIIITVFV